MSVSQLVTRVSVAGVELPVTDTRLVLDEGWSPRCAATFTVPYTPERAAALDPRDQVRVDVSLERSWFGATTTLDDLSDEWAALPPGPPTYLVRTNLLAATPSFEAVSAAWTATSGAAILRVNTEKHSGTWSLRVTTPGVTPNEGMGQQTGSLTPVTAGKPYMCSAWVKAPAGALVRFTARLSTAGGVNTDTLVPFTGTGAWQRVSALVTPVAGQVTAGLQVRNQGTAAYVYYCDDMMVEQTTELRPYFDGSTPDVPGVDYAWTGAPNVSASTETTEVPDPGTTLDDLTALWGPTTTLDDLTARWIIDWGNGARPADVVTADLILRERTIDHATATIALRATSDELLAQDAHAYVVRPVEPLPERLFQLLAAGHVPIGPPPDFTAGAIYVAMPEQTTEWSQSIWDSMQANANSVGLRLWCDEARVWRLGPADPAPTSTVDLPRVIDASDTVNRDGDYADVLVWVGKGINNEGLPLTDTKTWPEAVPAGPYRAAVVEHDYGTVGAGLPMPSDDELAARLTLLQSRDRVLALTAPADPTVRPGMGVTTGAPSLPGTSSVVARVEWAVPADTMTITTRATTEV